MARPRDAQNTAEHKICAVLSESKVQLIKMPCEDAVGLQSCFALIASIMLYQCASYEQVFDS